MNLSEAADKIEFSFACQILNGDKQCLSSRCLLEKTLTAVSVLHH